MIANYHTHTPRCRHARGLEEEYARIAAERGLKILGFSDHSPYAFPSWFDSDFRMRVDQLDDYVQAVRRVQDAYRGTLEIHLGVELEYYPAYFTETLEMLKDRGVEYAILGQHFVESEIDAYYCGYRTENAALLRRYADQVITGMELGYFSYLAHPDLCHYTGDVQEYQRQMRRICQAANDCGLPLELNMLGLYGKRHYPNPRFWEVAAEENCKVILGCDAHDPEFLCYEPVIQQGLEFLEPYQLEIVDTVPLCPLGGK